VKKNAGLFTALAALIAVFGLSNLPKNSSGGSAQTVNEPTRGAKSATKTGSAGTIFSPCEEIQKRLQPLLTDINEWPGTDIPPSWTMPDFCYSIPPTKNIELKAKNVDFVIAMVPNPVATHLPLSFDRILEIIQQAAQDNNYSYESSWLPWNETKGYSHLSDQLLADETQDFQERQPGVLVFRNPSIPDHGGEGGLVIFMVSELPTGGINQLQFYNALVWINQLRGLSSNEKVRVLGPNFSGSLPSVYRALHFRKVGTFSGKLTFRVFSGSVTSETSYSWLNDQLIHEHLGSFQTAMEGDSRQLSRFCAYIGLQGYKTNRIAFLSEDETAFGGRAENSDQEYDPCNVSGGPTYLYYPRDIATLRSAYEQQSIFNSTKQVSNTNEVSSTLRGDLSEPANSEHDTVRSYGGQLTPLAQESVLLAITQVLKAKKIQFVIVRSTNSLDQIFLGQFLRRSVPETRIVMDGADLLFRRGAEGASLRGVMLLSTYPLLTWQQEWTSSAYQKSSWWRKWWQTWILAPTSGEGETYRIIGEDNAEGVYVAARELFPAPPKSDYDAHKSVAIANYAPPVWARSPNGNDEQNKRPATWLTVVGHRQFWPVAVLNQQTLKGFVHYLDPYSMLPTSTELKQVHVLVDGGDPDSMGTLPVEFGILMFLCVAWSLIHLLWCKRGSISPAPLAFRLACFAPVPRWQHPVLIGFGSVMIASVAIVVAGTSGLLELKLGNWNGVVALTILALFVIAYWACASNYKLPTITQANLTGQGLSKWRRMATRRSLELLVIFAGLQLLLFLNLNQANSVPTFWRSVHILSGVSPLLPQIFLLIGLYFWFWFCLRGLALFGTDRPLVPRDSDLWVDGIPVPMFARDQAQTKTESEAIPIRKPYWTRAGLIFLIVVAISVILLGGRPWLRTLGERGFGYFTFFWIGLCITLILTDTVQCWLIWKRLQVLLHHINLLPVRRTLNALEGLSWRSVWAMSGNVLSERYCLISRQLEAMRHLQNQVNAWVPTSLDDATTRDKLLMHIGYFQNNELKPFSAWYRSLLENEPDANNLTAIEEVQEEMASIAAFVFVNILTRSWRTETDSLIIDRSRTKNHENEVYAGPAIYAKMPPHVLAAEEFFVLPYIGFIQNILGRIRTIVLGMLFLFVATTLAVSSYPFDPLPVLGGIFLALFIITGTTIVVIYAVMHRDATLSYITDTSPGELGGEFWRQVFAFGIGPLIGLLTTLFPSITDFVVSWLQPSTQVIK